MIDEVYVVIDGQSFDAEAIGTEADFVAANGAGTGISEGRSERASAAQSVWYVFDIDGDVTIDEGDEVEMEVVIDFKEAGDAGANYPNGTTIKASVTSLEAGAWEAEGADDLDPGQFDGTAVGDAHVLVAEGIVVPVDGFSSESRTLGDNDNIGEFSLEFEVTGVEGNFFITDRATQADEDDGIRFLVSNGGDAAVTGTLTSTADEVAGVFEVREGETETFTLTVTLSAATTLITPRVTLTEVNYSEGTDGIVDGGAGDVEGTYLPTPVSDFRTGIRTIQRTI